MTQRNLYTQTAHRSFYRPTFLHAKTSPRAVFSQQIFFRTETLTRKKNMHNSFYRQTVFTDRKLSAQKSYAQKVLRTTFLTYRRFYTQMSFHRHKLHTETCARNTRLNTANFYTERLCFPFLITYLSCSPSQVFLNRGMDQCLFHTLWSLSHPSLPILV